MKKLLLTLLVLCVAICTNANTIYELSAATCTAATKATGPWAFNNGFSIMPADESKTYQSANGGIKYSAGVQYTITLPAGVSIKHVEIVGYNNYADAVSTAKSITFADAATGTITFTPQGKQVVWTISLYDYNPADVKEEEPTGDRNTNLYYTPESQMEKLDRAPVALPASSGKGVFLSWRFLGTDNLQTKFDVVRNGSIMGQHLPPSDSRPSCWWHHRWS